MEIYINGIKLLRREKINNIISYFLIDGTILKTKELKDICVMCDKCKKETHLKIFPTTKKDFYKVRQRKQLHL